MSDIEIYVDDSGIERCDECDQDVDFCGCRCHACGDRPDECACDEDADAS